MFSNPSLKGYLALTTLYLALQIPFGIIVSNYYLLRQNTLSNNGAWVSTKSNLEVSVMGARSFIYEPHALTKNRLNLGAWHGFQEVIYQDSLQLKEVEFDFLLSPGAYLNFIFNKSQSGFSGIRISTNRHFDSMYFTASGIGEFLHKTSLKTRKVSAGIWHQMNIRFQQAYIEAFIDGNRVGKFKWDFDETQRIGFRGGKHEAVVDNISIYQNKTDAIFETFKNSKSAFLITVISVVIAMILSFLFASALNLMRKLSGKVLAFYGIMFNIVLLIIAAFMLSFQYLKAPGYPRIDARMERKEGEGKRIVVAKTVRYIKKNYPEQKTADNVLRLLFLGTSQTYGVGASTRARTFVQVLEDKLNLVNVPGTYFQCINAGMPGVNSPYIINQYEKEWLQLNPKIVVINLGTNDRKPDWLALNITRIIDMSLEAGIQPVLLLEPNSLEHNTNSLLSKHQLMRVTGESRGIPVIDMHSYLRDKYDDGFLWWDFVHLTDFGQKLFAEKLYNELEQIVQELI